MSKRSPQSHAPSRSSGWITLPRKAVGSRLLVTPPGVADRDWIFASLQNPEIYQPFGCPAPPSREMFDRHLLLAEDLSPHVQYYVIRLRKLDTPIGFVLAYPWDASGDGTMELDSAIPEPRYRRFAYQLEGNVLTIYYLFAHRLAKRVRWKTVSKGRPPRDRFGFRYIGETQSPHPQTGEPVPQQLFEMTRKEFEKLARAAGADPNDIYGKPFWLAKAGTRPGAR